MSDLQTLAGKRVLLTGGTTGIGRAIAIMLASQGSKVFTFGRHEPELADALRDICAVGEANGTTADTSQSQDVKRVFQQATEWLGGLDILINNAALGGGGLADTDDAEWRQMVETNLIGYMAMAKEALTHFQEQKKGHLLMIGSMSADVREKGSSVYVATKSAIQGLAEALRKEVNARGIKVSLIEPGAVGSDMQPTTPRQERKHQEKGEMLKAEDIAECVRYVLTQPPRCDVVVVQIRPHLQEI